MEQRLSLITLGVADLARSVAFYKALGWMAGFENEQIVCFQLNGFIFSLFPKAELDKDMTRDNTGTGCFSLAFNVREKSEVDRVLDEAVAAGGAMLKSAEEVFWGGYSGYFTDPDGHAWEVAWNEAWPIDAAGHISLS